jgi:hypothetical protein
MTARQFCIWIAMLGLLDACGKDSPGEPTSMVSVQYDLAACRVAGHTDSCDKIAHYLLDSLLVNVSTVITVVPDDDCHWKAVDLDRVVALLRQAGYPDIKRVTLLAAPDCPNGHRE